MTTTKEKESLSEANQQNVKPIKVCLLVGSLEFGGAERQVVEMARSFDRSLIEPVVCSLSKEVPLAEGLKAGEGCELKIIEKKSRFDLTAVLRFAKFVREQQFDVVHAFLFDSEIVARLAAPLAGFPLVVASERNTDYVRPLLHTIATKCTLPLVDVMVANSNSGKRFNMRTLGLSDSKIEVVHNGLDVSRFYRDREVGREFRQSHGIPTDAPVVAMVGSFKRQKGHCYFLEMAASVLKEIPDAHFLVVGGVIRGRTGESNEYADEILDLVKKKGLEDRCQFLGIQKDVLSVYNACDVTTLLSLREGTPNVVLESMACEVPVVVADVSDNAIIVEDGKTGFVVPKEDSRLAAKHVIRLLSDSDFRDQMGKDAQNRIRSDFSLETTAGKLDSIYRRHLDSKG